MTKIPHSDIPEQVLSFFEFQISSIKIMLYAYMYSFIFMYHPGNGEMWRPVLNSIISDF